MKALIPVMNTVNFIAIFTILYFTNVVDLITLAIGSGAGILLGILIELIFHHHSKQKTHVKHLNDYNKTKKIEVSKPKSNVALILLTITLGIMVVIGATLAAVGFIPLGLEGHATKEDAAVINQTNETVEEEPEEPEEPEIIYEGHCEEKEMEKVCITVDGESACSHEAKWLRSGFKCNTLEDCIDQLDTSGRAYDPEEVQCNLE